MPLSDDFLLTQVTIDLVDGPRSRARLYVDPDDVRGRGLDATFLNVRQVVDMTDATVALWWQHDQAPALRGLESFEAVDASVGRWKVHWPSAMGQSAGTVTAKIMVSEGDREVAIPLPALEVSGDRVDPSATPSEDTFSVLAELLLEWRRGETEIGAALERAETAASAAEDVAERAARGEFDGKGLELKGAYDTFEELEEAQPSAGDGDAYAAGDHLFVWSGGGWRDQGTFRGPTGETGAPAGFGTLTATIDPGVGEPAVTATWDGPDTAKDLTLELSGLKGDPGEDGVDGVSVTHEWEGTTLKVTSASGTSEADLKGDTGEPGADGVSVTHEWEGTTLSVTSASGTSSADLKGDPGPKGDTGEGINVLDHYDDYEAMTAAHPSGDRVGDGYMAGTHYYVWNGEEWRDCGELKGAKGDTGDPAGFGEVTAEVGTGTGEPSVEVETSGTPDALDVLFSFDGLKGDEGLGYKGSVANGGVTGTYDELEGYVGTTQTLGDGTLWSQMRVGDVYSVNATVTDQGDAQGTLLVQYEGHQGMFMQGKVVAFLCGKRGVEGPEGPRGETGERGPKGDPGDIGDEGAQEALLKRFLLAAHPVGSYYWSEESTSPETLFGGEWEAVEGRFVWAKSSSESAGDTGGAKTVALTESQMPSHSHTGPSHSHSLNSHTHSVPAHSHGLNSHTHSIPSHSHGLNSHTHSMSHSHGFKVTYQNYKTADSGTYGVSSLGSGRSQSFEGTTASYSGSTGAASGSTASGGSGTTGSASGSTANSSSLTTGESSGSTGSGGTGYTGSAGSGSAHENMPPYVSAYCWRRTA